MVKNLQGLHRMRSSPAINNNYNSSYHNYHPDNMAGNGVNGNGVNGNSLHSHSHSHSPRPDSQHSHNNNNNNGPINTNETLRNVLAASTLAEQAELLSLLKQNVQRLNNVSLSHDAPQVPPIAEMYKSAAEQERPNDFLLKQMAQLESSLRSEHERLDKILDDAKATLEAPSTSQNRSPARPPYPQATADNAKVYCKPFCDFLTENPTVFHAVDAIGCQLQRAGFKKLSERDIWDIKKGGKYYVERNGSAVIAFVVGEKYDPGNGSAILAGHIDALTAKLKPVSQVPNKAGYVQLGVAPYAGGMGNTWWDRDLSIGGRVLVKEDGRITTRLVKLGWPIAKIPTLAPHFGANAVGPFNQETQMTPIVGLESAPGEDVKPAGPPGSFTSTQPPRLVRAIANELGIRQSDYGNIIQWELELYDTQPADLLGLDKEFITAGRIDDKLCSWAAIQALINSASYHTPHSGLIKTVFLSDDEEIGSGLRQGAKSNFLNIVLERVVCNLAGGWSVSPDLMGRTYANSFIVSSDVTHAVNPNFLSTYLENHAPALNTGVVVAADSNGHMTTDGVSTAIFSLCAERVGSKLQVFQIRNDSRSGGTVGPMLSCATGIRTIDAGLPQLSMHSIRATTGNLDPGLGVICFEGYLNGFEDIDREFRE
ncbi:hypothetical protein AAFC00_003323 [Neodothiora populina]|uniref:Aspartyl aminopeptidase n=1 Tax=Neodothiora populina TaxID=2781224 RepID=A0ABR3PAC2_9PEZI